MNAFAPLRRALVLMALEAQYPHGLTAAAILRQMGPYYVEDENAFTKDMAYLEAQDLAVKEEVDVPTADLLRYAARRRDAKNGRLIVDPSTSVAPVRALEVWKITPRGINVVDGTVSDAGVVFADEVKI